MCLGRHQLQDLIRDVLLEECLLRESSAQDQTKAAYKAIFMAGCPAAGKGTVKDVIIQAFPFASSIFKDVNVDTMYEFLLKKHKVGLQDPATSRATTPYPEGHPLADIIDVVPEEEAEAFRAERSSYRSAAAKHMGRAKAAVTGGAHGMNPKHLGLDPSEYSGPKKRKESATSRLEDFVNNGLGVIIDGTAANFDRVTREKQLLEDMGYRTMMIVVKVPAEEAVGRNIGRGEKDRRSIGHDVLYRQCLQLVGGVDPKDPEGEPIVGVLDKYRPIFGEDNFIEIDNTLPTSETVTPEVKSKVSKFLSQPLSSIAQEREDLKLKAKQRS